ncbi:MAG: DUF459 domain-containing protein [Nannocystaceae bacterium]
MTASLAASLVPRRARAESGGRILLMGGSQIAGGVGLYLGNQLTALGFTVHRKAKSSSGLARPDFFDWQAEAARQFEQFRPDATVCLFGGNDGQGLHMGKDADPKWIRWNEEGWTEEYRRRVEAFATAVTPDDQRMCWLGMPMVRPPKLRSRVQHMNEIFEWTMATRDKWHYIETWSALATAGGEYTDHLVIDGKRTLLRGHDGVHLTVKGAHHLADFVAPRVQALMG